MNVATLLVNFFPYFSASIIRSERIVYFYIHSVIKMNDIELYKDISMLNEAYSKCSCFVFILPKMVAWMLVLRRISFVTPVKCIVAL